MAEYVKDERFMGHSANEVVRIICNDCIHFKGRLKCKAFSIRIPDVILNGINNHSEPLPDQDNDYVFEPVEVN